MKYLILLVALFTGGTTVAQQKNKKPINIAVGQKINIVTTNVSDADMGMGMQMKNNSVTSNTIVVTGENEKEFTLSNTITKLKATIVAMGETREYDSEKEADRNSEMGKSLSEAIGKPINVKINKFSGTAIFDTADASPEKPEKNPMEDMIKAFGSGGEDPAVQGAFLVLPSGKKTGDTWTESDSSKEKKSLTTYTLHSIKENTATISFITVSDANNTFELQGNQMAVAVKTNSKGEILADMKTGLVKSRINDSDISGTMDVMGQSLPITAKSHLVTLYSVTGN